MRSYLNEKISLVEAETIADLITAESFEKLKAISKSLSGDFEKELNEAVLKLKKIRTKIEGEIDFNDQDLGEINILNMISDLIELLKKEQDGFKDIRSIKEGLEIAIIGPPNVGKSTLINNMVKRDVSLTSRIAGTTRDIIEVHLNIDGFPDTRP